MNDFLELRNDANILFTGLFKNFHFKVVNLKWKNFIENSYPNDQNDSDNDHQFYER